MRSSPVRSSAMTAWLRWLARPWQFAGAVWIALATVLICAVAPSGLPQTLQHGSAFNPATTVVALNAGPGGSRLLVKRILRNAAAQVPDAAHAAFALLLPDPVDVLTALKDGVSAPAAIAHAESRLAEHRQRPWPTGPPRA